VYTADLIQFIGEFLGTFMFLFFAFAAANIALQDCATCGLGDSPSVAQLLYISLAFGFSLAVNAWVFFRISGGLFNPAVTFGLMLIGCLTLFRAGVVFIAQILGAIAAAAVVKGLFPYVSSPTWQLVSMIRFANSGR
jgi:aquaporin related protein